jgi:D-3-phosphoglycerate dehydrogenase
LNDSTRSGKWERSSGIELCGKTIGIIGLGSIGKIVALCAKGFNMNVMAYDPFIREEYCREHNIEISSFDDIIQKADAITLHLPLNDSTYHLFNREVISKMKDSAILINTSRGGIIDEDAAYEALKQGKLGGLGLDAFEIEPPDNSPLFSLDNVVVTPHTGAHTKEASDKMASMAVKNLIDVLSGKDCPYIVN